MRLVSQECHKIHLDHTLHVVLSKPVRIPNTPAATNYNVMKIRIIVCNAYDVLYIEQNYVTHDCNKKKKAAGLTTNNNN